MFLLKQEQKARKESSTFPRFLIPLVKRCRTALPGLHAVSGCDSTSAFFGIGKSKFYKTVKGSGCFLEMLSQIMEQLWIWHEYFSCYSNDDCGMLWRQGVLKHQRCPIPEVLHQSESPRTASTATERKTNYLFHCQRAHYVASNGRSALTATTNTTNFGHDWVQSEWSIINKVDESKTSTG